MKPASERNDRRRFLKLAAGITIIAAAGVVAGILKVLPANSPTVSTPSSTETVSSTQALAWPRLKVVNANSLDVGRPLVFNYPLQTTPNIIVKLGMKADNGVGPDGDIVAFSRICTHQGCLIVYLSGTILDGYCPCHGSQFDFINNGSIMTGPATQPIPRALLEYDEATGDIYVAGMGPPVIFGQGPRGDTNPADALQYDLQGGPIVTQITVSPLEDY